MKTFYLLMAFLCLQTSVFAQDFTGTIRGQIIDKQSKSPIPGANVIVLNTNPPQGSASDVNGFFKILNVKTGRVSLQVSFLGYEPFVVNNLNLLPGKELILNAELEESLVQMNEVVISATQDKFQTNNDLTVTSTRSFTVEESQRYAGARNDVARMAANFAGVRGADDSQNNIVIRGNSPAGLLWRLEGIDIPNPNHYGFIGSTGGPVSILNNNVLANSDFMTGAFSPDYGNATSGVFDLKMRNGNNEKHEFLGQIGFNGFELGAEGPISKESRSSYLVNYRYSTLGFFKLIGVNFGVGAAMPNYQDLTFKLNMPTKKLGTFEVFGIGGVSSIELLASKEDSTDVNFYNDNTQDVYNSNKMGVVGASNTYLINNSTFAKLTLSASYIQNGNTVDTIDFSTRKPVFFAKERFTTTKYQAHFFVKKKFSSRLNLKTGILYSFTDFNMFGEITQAEGPNFRYFDDKGTMDRIQPYFALQYRVSEELTINTGIHAHSTSLNNEIAVEPRFGMSYKANSKNIFSAAYGLHSISAPLNVLFAKTKENDVEYQHNKDLGFTKSHHFVIGYEHRFNESLRLKTEVYYQNMFNAPVSNIPSAYSGLNYGLAPFGFPDSLQNLVNSGTGQNYGIEFTFEKSLNKGFYLMSTVSLYESKYKGSDGIERNTVFNSNYVANVLAGKEFELNKNAESKKSKKYLVFDVKFTTTGGQRYTDILLDESRARKQEWYDWNNLNGKQFGNYLRLDTKISYKTVGKKVTQEIALDCQNITNRQNDFFQSYNAKTGNVNMVYQLGLFIIPQYKIIF